MARTRGDAIISMIGKTVKEAALDRVIGETALAQMISEGCLLHVLVHPDGWPWNRQVIEIENQNERVALSGASAPAELAEIEVQQYGIRSVATRVGTLNGETYVYAGDWKPLLHREAESTSQRPFMNRRAATVWNQRWWAEEWESATARYLATYPGSFANSNLAYRLVFYQKPPLVTIGSDFDSAFLQPEEDDIAVAYGGAIHVANALGDDAAFNRAIGLFQMTELARLKGYGITKLGVKLPPYRVLKEVSVQEEVG